jgi:hypothetical protein
MLRVACVDRELLALFFVASGSRQTIAKNEFTVVFYCECILTRRAPSFRKPKNDGKYIASRLENPCAPMSSVR